MSNQPNAVLNVKGIKCDNEACDYTDPTATLEQMDSYLNKPCPKCGDSLLTPEDHEALLGLLALTEAINALTEEDVKEIAQIAGVTEDDLKDVPDYQKVTFKRVGNGQYEPQFNQ